MGPFQQAPLGAQTFGGTKIIEIRVGSETYLGGGIFNIISHGEYQPLVEKNAYSCSICCGDNNHNGVCPNGNIGNS
jgi:hypothetical protein